MECDDCLDDLERYGDEPACWAPDGGGCPRALPLHPRNLPVWEAYLRVHDVVLPAAVLWGGTGVDPLDIPGVLRVLDWLGLSPDDPEERDYLLEGIRTIHQVRMELAAKDAS